MLEPLPDEYFMREALRQAQKAYAADEVPVGAVVVREGKIIGRAHNQVELLKDATAHAEMLALTQAEAADRRLASDGLRSLCDERTVRYVRRRGRAHANPPRDFRLRRSVCRSRREHDEPPADADL